MRGFLFSAALAALLLPAAGLRAQQDSTLVEELSESIVVGVRARKDAPYAVANMDRAELSDFSATGKELPLLFARTPGVLAWSENGVGTGTSYMRIRGAGDSRINVTIDGVPLNSPEDQCVFWANMNSYAAFTGSAQIQRGVGTSTNGDGAFGGTVSLSTKAPSLKPSSEVSASYGSFNTRNFGVNASTGLIRDALALDLSMHHTGTDGYLHGTDGKSGSIYAGITFLGNGFMLRYHNVYNYEHTGQAWNGVVAGNDNLSLMDGTYGASTGIRSYKDLCAVGLGRFNNLYEALVFDGDAYDFPKDASGNYQTRRYSMNDGSFWPRTTDNFEQDHNILSIAGRLSPYLTGNAALHYTYGYGYYDEFRPNNKIKKFGLSDPSVKRTDFVRKKGLEQNTLGLVGNLEYKKDGLDVIGGISAQAFRGSHFGYLTYIADAALDAKYRPGGKDYLYYDSDASKNDLSGFVKASYRLGDWQFFGDVQYRHVDYTTGGINDKFIENADGTFSNQALDIEGHYNFVNPKAGVSFGSGPHRAYASVALSHREPERNNFTDNGSYPAPEPESLLDYEAGYQFGSNALRLGVNLYYMDYTGQFVQTGAVSDIGEALTTNIARSYRTGVELSAAWDASGWLTFEGNAALSRNRILDFDEHVEDWDNGEAVIHYDNSTLAFSPAAILNGFADFRFGAFKATWHTGYVSRMYLDNTGNEARSLPAYTASDVNLSYTFTPRRFCRSVVLGCNLGNVFGARYAQSGWVYSAIYESGGHPNDNRYCQIGFIPAAGFTAMGSVRVSF